MKTLIAAGTTAVLAVTPLVGALGPLAGQSLAAGTTRVRVKDNRFGPTRITVRRGTTVRWVWRGKLAHNVTVVRGPARFHSRTQVKGSFARRLTRRGVYTIFCTIHAPGMKMTVKVR